MDPIALFFLFGLTAGLIKSDLRLPPEINDFLTFFLLMTIGLKGGIELHGQNLLHLLPQFLLVASLGILIPLVAYPILRHIGRIQRVDAASIAAHYGSVSVGTFAVCIAFLTQRGVSFEAYVSIFVVILEIPAILIGIILAKGVSKKTQWSKILIEVGQSKGILLLVGGLLIGWMAGKEKLGTFTPFFFDLFYGMLALFLIEMGIIVSKQLSVVKKYGLFLIVFGTAMPVLFGSMALGFGLLLNLSLGGTVVLTVLGASSSYIAVPAAMRMSVPEANLSLSLGSSLGITFPFNIIFGIPLFYRMASHFF